VVFKGISFPRSGSFAIHVKLEFSCNRAPPTPSLCTRWQVAQTPWTSNRNRRNQTDQDHDQSPANDPRSCTTARQPTQNIMSLYFFPFLICIGVLAVAYSAFSLDRADIQSHSTVPLRGEMTPTTLASKSRIEPPCVATRSPDKEVEGFTPRSLSRLADASASASDLDM